MFRTRITPFVALAFISGQYAAAQARPTKPIPAIVSISIFNDARVPSKVLDAGEARTSRILSRAGIQVEWLNCTAVPPPIEPLPTPALCSAISYPSHLSVRIVSHWRSLSGDTFGESFQDQSGTGCYADIYFPRLSTSEARKFVRDGDMLGYVIAHEIGHLLLGANSHSPFGLMRAHWQPDDLRLASRGGLYFTSAQATFIRSRLGQSDGLHAGASASVPLAQ